MEADLDEKFQISTEMKTKERNKKPQIWWMASKMTLISHLCKIASLKIVVIADCQKQKFLWF